MPTHEICHKIGTPDANYFSIFSAVQVAEIDLISASCSPYKAEFRLRKGETARSHSGVQQCLFIDTEHADWRREQNDGCTSSPACC